MKKLSIIFCLLAVLLSDIMCAVVAYNYRDILCSIEHAGYSAPASTAFLLSHWNCYLYRLGDYIYEKI